MMKINQHEIWIANLNPRFGTEAGKAKLVVIVPTDLLNRFHPSIIICPITTNVKPDVKILRVLLVKGTSNLKEDCDIMIDQIRAIDNKRLIKKIGGLNREHINSLREKLSIVLDL
jgi:mRNA interferase MazF